MADALIHNSDARRAAKQAYDRARYLRLRTEKRGRRAPDPIAELAATDLAYLAGLTDADGSIFVTHTNRLKTYYPTVCWAMTHKPTIQWVSEAVGGGSPVLHNHTNLRRGSTSWGTSNFREQWRTQVSGSRAKLLCERMIPYMRTKVRQAGLVAAFPVDERRAPGVHLSETVRLEREHIGAEISRINRGG